MVKRLFFWLSGAGTVELESCPPWEQRKYVAFGATVLVPTIFAFIACTYAVSTISNNPAIIVGVALAWSFIILTVDRALLSTYRPFQPWHRKLGQFFLRFVVAMLMGLTISHPLTLLLFRDTIRTEIEAERDHEIEELRSTFAARQEGLRREIGKVEEDIAAQREKWAESFSAEFLTAQEKQDPANDRGENRAAFDQQLEGEMTPYRERLTGLNAEREQINSQYVKLQGELSHWQAEFEREVNGQRSGLVGLGPRARSIQSDHLDWRRKETARLASVLEHLTAQVSQTEQLMVSVEENLTREHEALAAAALEKEQAEELRLAELRDMIQTQQAQQFVEQQNALRATISTQIDTRLADLARLQEDSANLAKDENQRIEAIRLQPRDDLLTQTLALHELFLDGRKGGSFALTAYLVLAVLFLLVDTIPIILKFFCKPGPYDTIVDREETQYDQEREAFQNGYREYMQKLTGGNLLNLTTNRPLERALVEGVDRSRVAKEFLESLLEMESAFQKRIEAERANHGSASAAERAQMLEAMAASFYRDLHTRMESFFESAPRVKS